jgi:catecholate siderophore receptor
MDFNRSLGDEGPLPGAAVRLNIYGQDSGVSGRDYVENTGYGFAPSLALGLGTPTRIFVGASYESQDNLPDSGVPAAGVGEGLFLDPAGAPNVLIPVQSPIPGDITDNFYGFAKHDYERVITRSALVRIEHDITPDVRLSNQTKVGDARRDSISSFIANAAAYDPGTGLVTIRRGRSVTDNTVISNQTNLVTSFDTGSVAHDLNVGLELSRESQFSPTYTALTNAGTQDIENPDPGATPIGDPTRAPNSPFSKGRIDTASIHLFDTLHLTDKLMLNLGGRLEHYQVKGSSLAADTTLPLDTTPVRLEGSDTLFSYKAGIVYKPAPNGSLYAAYGNSFTPPGTNFTLSSQAGNANDPAVDPQEAHNYEVGVKWEFFESRLSTSLAFFRSINENVATNLGTTAVPNFVYDTEQRTEGVELGISGRITPEWLVYGGIAYMESETSSQNAANGADLRFTPKISANLWTTYALFKNFTIGGGVQYSESVSRSTSGTVSGSTTNPADSYVVAEVPSYWVFNALAEYAVTKNIAVRLNVNNLFDEDYYRINNNGGRFYPGASRTFVLSAAFKF